MTRSTEIIIIGSGPTGLGAATRLLELGRSDFLCLEASDSVGGLASTITDQKGFSWDLGCHVQHSHYDKFDEYMDLALESHEWLDHERNTFIWHDQRYIPYPFQLNLHHLSPREQWSCVKGLIAINDQSVGIAKPINFEEWCLQQFGVGIAELFMLPYNEKIWARPAKYLGSQWVGDRVAKPSLVDALKGICLQQDSTCWGPNAHFRYPKEGGTGRIWSRIANRVPDDHLITKERVVKIDAKQRVLTCLSGNSYCYDHLISTMPVTSLCEMLRDSHLMRQSQALAKNRTHLVGIGLKGSPPPKLQRQCWGYYPQSDVPFYRLTVMSNLSSAMTPTETHWSLLTETAESEHFRPPKDLGHAVRASLEKIGLINRSNIVSCWQKSLEYGYPVPTVDRDATVDPILKQLDAKEIYSRGRFGAWKYEVSNQDHSFMQGVEVIDHVLFDAPELTLKHQDLVNARQNSFPPPEWTHVCEREATVS